MSRNNQAVKTTILSIPESNNSSLLSNENTQARGIFIVPDEKVINRPSDITGYSLIASTNEGKVEWGQPIIDLEDISDVSITNVQINDIITWDGTNWVNTSDPSFQSITTSGPITNGTILIDGDQITGLGLPLTGDSAVSKDYVDNAVVNVDWKDPVRAVTTVALTPGSIWPPTDGLATVSTVDGVTLANGDRVLVKDGAGNGPDPFVQNGYWIATESAPGVGTWTRAPDMQNGTAAANFATVATEGTLNAGLSFVCTSENPNDIVGVSPLSFGQFADVIVAGDGLTKISNVLSVNVDGSSIEIVGAGNGDLRLTDTPVTPGTYPLANVTVDQQGRVIGISTGSGDIADLVPLRTLTGTATGDTNLGTFTGSVIPDNSTVKSAFQSVELVSEANQLAVTTLQGDVTTLQGDVTLTLQGDVTTLQGETLTLQGDVTTLQGETLTLQGDVTTLQGETLTLQGDVTTLQGETLTLQGDVTTLQGDVTTLQGETLTLQGDVTTLQGDVTTLQGETLTLQGDVTTLQGETLTLQGDVTTLQGDVTTLQGQVGSGTVETTAIRTQTGTLPGSVDYGIFTGTVIPDNSTAKVALQSLETAVESLPSATEVTSLRTQTGTLAGANDYGIFTGTVIPDNSTGKTAFQSLETAVEGKANTVDIADLVPVRTLTGTASGDTTLGTFTGSIISDNTVIKTALQELETESENVSSTVTTVQGDLSTNDTETAAIRTTTGTVTGDLNMGTFTGTTITDNSTIKVALQELETAVDATPSQPEVTSIRTLTGTAAGANDLGTFTGSIITDNSTIKTALQEVETTMETFQNTAGRTLSSISMTSGVDLSNTEIFALQPIIPVLPDIIEFLGINSRVFNNFQNCEQARFQVTMVGLDLTLLQSDDEFVLQYFDINGTGANNEVTGSWVDVATAKQGQITILQVSTILTQRDVIILSNWFDLNTIPGIFDGSTTPAQWPRTPEALMRMITRRTQAAPLAAVSVDIGRVSFETR